jgi:ABC-type nitrate/sulfonate/bicarbonate transport system substrate-binding protein
MQAPAEFNPYARRSASDELRIGYVPLIDAAPLIVARELGYFVKHGVRVRLSRALGWGTIRDKLIYGELDAAHAPAGFLFSLVAGTHAPATDVQALMLLSQQGNAITLSKRLWQKGARDGKTLRQVLRMESPRKPVLAVVSWQSTHHYLLRTWLQKAGIDPDKDVRLTVLPPGLVGEHLRLGQIDGFCVGEPWNSAAVLRGDGWIAATSQDIAPGHAEKILLAPTSRLEARPEEFAAVRAALLEACRFCDRPKNRPQLAELLHQHLFPALPSKVIENSLIGPCDLGAARMAEPSAFARFDAGDANHTTAAQAMELLEQLESCRALHLTPTQRKQAVAAYLNPSNPALPRA